MAVALLLVVIAASFVLVRIGAAALELTGMGWDQAKFQALSAFTNAGFTTRESEQVTEHPVRRRIISYLVILGNAGLVTTIGTLASSLMAVDIIDFFVNLAVIVTGIAFLLWLARRPRLAQRMRAAAQARLLKRYGSRTFNPRELLRLDEGYTLTRIVLSQDTVLAGHSLADLKLSEHRLLVLAIERGDSFLSVPRGRDRVHPGDGLVVYGARQVAEKVFKSDQIQALTLVAENVDPEPTESSADQQAS